MPNAKLDHFFVLTATCPEGRKKIDYYDTSITGFILEVRASGGKTFSLKYRDDHGRQRQYKIGNFGDITVDKARREAQKVRSRVTVGENPSEERQVKRSIPTVQQLADRYLEYVRGYKRCPDIDERYLRNHILPKFGRMRLDELTQEDVTAWLKSKVKVEGYKPATVNRLQTIISYMYKLARRWDMPGSERNPLKGVPLYDPNNGRERFLTPDETARLKAAVEESDNTQLKYIVALLLLTGCRKRELLDARWEHFDLPRRTWRIPMTKAGKARSVPLSSEALAVIAQIPRFNDCPYLLPNPKTGEPFDNIYNSWHTARTRAGLADVRVHDLRHSAASNMVNAGQSLYVVGKVLGHAQPKTTERYAHLSQDTLLVAVDAAAKQMGTSFAQLGASAA